MKKGITFIVALFVMIGQLRSDGSTYLNFTAVGGPATIMLECYGFPNDISLQYSTDNCTTWNELSTFYNIELSSGEKVYIKATSTNSTFNYSFTKRYGFTMTGTVSADGNIMSLLDATMQQTYVPESAFDNLFSMCTSMIQAPVLPATTLASRCYYQMFSSCTSLTKAPELPATTLAESCYSGMFMSCQSLTQVPDFPAATMATCCCEAMFNSCFKLEKAPALPSTALAKACYRDMFVGCKSLKQIPTLPATTLAEECYKEMFIDCNALEVNDSAPGDVWRIPANADTANAKNWNTYMFVGTAGTFTGDPVVGRDYYVASKATGVSYVEGDLDIRLAPNPVKTGERILLNGNFSDVELNGMTVEVVDLKGMVVRRDRVNASPVEIEGVDAAGTYIVRITDGTGKVYTQKLIVE